MSGAVELRGEVRDMALEQISYAVCDFRSQRVLQLDGWDREILLR